MSLRSLALAAVLASLPALASANPLEDQTLHQRFACLQRELALGPLPEKTLENRNNGLLRFKLRFESADKPPTVELLFAQADSDMERLAREYLGGYRLPCLHKGDHPIEVVQEFSFSRWGKEPAVPLATKGSNLRFAFPEDAPPLNEYDVGKALVEYVFVEGQDEPRLRFIFSGVGAAAERVIRRYASQVRLLDAGGQPRPITVRQPWVFRDPESQGTQYQLTKEEYKLTEFLRFTKNLQEHLIDLDLDSMQCPFAVRLNLRQPYEANEVHEIESHNPNRAYLLNWLSKLRLRFDSLSQQKDMFGSDYRISIPCGRLDLTALKKPSISPS